MEHDAERIIREKIKIAELEPVTWNKEIVWSAINKGPAHKLNRVVFYYAAASLLLATTLLYYVIKTTEQEETKMQKSVATLFKKKHDDRYILEITKAKEKNSSQHTKKMIAVPSAPSSLIILDVMADSTMVSMTIRENISLVNEESVFASDTTERTVDPIIGIYIPKKENAVARKEKRMRVRFFSPQEKNMVHGEPATPIILARINENLK